MIPNSYCSTGLRHNRTDIQRRTIVRSFLQVAGVAVAGRHHFPIHLMASLLYLKHAYKLSAEELAEQLVDVVLRAPHRCQIACG